MWGWGPPGSRGQLPPGRRDDEAGRQFHAESRRRRRARAASIIALLVIATAVAFLAFQLFLRFA
jgi:hypothetical protein